MMYQKQDFQSVMKSLLLQEDIKLFFHNRANLTFDNDHMTGKITYKYYNDKMWPNRFATYVSVDEAIKLMES